MHRVFWWDITSMRGRRGAQRVLVGHHEYERQERCIECFGGTSRKKLLEDLGVAWKIILKMDLQEVGWAYELELSGSG